MTFSSLFKDVYKLRNSTNYLRSKGLFEESMTKYYIIQENLATTLDYLNNMKEIEAKKSFSQAQEEYSSVLHHSPLSFRVFHIYGGIIVISLVSVLVFLVLLTPFFVGLEKYLDAYFGINALFYYTLFFTFLGSLIKRLYKLGEGSSSYSGIHSASDFSKALLFGILKGIGLYLLFEALYFPNLNIRSFIDPNFSNFYFFVFISFTVGLVDIGDVLRRIVSYYSNKIKHLMNIARILQLRMFPMESGMNTTIDSAPSTDESKEIEREFLRSLQRLYENPLNISKLRRSKQMKEFINWYSIEIGDPYRLLSSLLSDIFVKELLSARKAPLF